MRHLAQIVAFAAVSMLGGVVTYAEEASLAFGGDQYAAGQMANISVPVGHDAFAIGGDVGIAGPVQLICSHFHEVRHVLSWACSRL